MGLTISEQKVQRGGYAVWRIMSIVFALCGVSLNEEILIGGGKEWREVNRW